MRKLRTMTTDSSGGPTVVVDAAHVLGTTAGSLIQRSTQIRKSVDDALTAKKSKDKGLGKSKGKAVDNGVSASGAASKDKKTSQPSTNSLADFLNGASAAQQSQIKMISQVFEAMDADGDGQLSVADVRAYFRTIGRNASDLVVRKWIGQRDVDQDGAVSLAEFVSSYSLQLDPASLIKGIPASHTTSPVTAAFGALCLGNSPAEVADACIATEEYVRRVLDSPSVHSFWRIFISDDAFNKRIGRLFGGIKLIQSMGFEPEQNGTVMALRDPTGRAWDSLPVDIRVMMNTRLGELKSHEQALMEPSVSNIAAGKSNFDPILLMSLNLSFHKCSHTK